MPVLKRIVGVVQALTLAAILVFVVLLFANEPDRRSEGPADSPAAASVDGATIYARSCSGCHGPRGEGGVGPQLGGGAVVRSLPDEEDHVAVVADGRGGMPAFGDTLSDEEIRAVVAYERTEL